MIHLQLGLTDSTDFTSTSTTIESAYKDISVNINSSSRFVDNEVPSVPGNLSAQITTDTVDLTWDAATDNVGVTLYQIFLDNTKIDTSTTTVFQTTGLNSGQRYDFSVIAQDASGNQSPPAVLSVTTLSPDTVAPSVPIGLILDSISETGVVISWGAATDTQGAVDSYRVFRDGTEVGISSITLFTDTTAQASQTYLYSVSAIDDTGNESSPSVALQIDTPGLPDTKAPSIPAGLTLNSDTENAISFSWAPSTDTLGTVVRYHIVRDGSEIDTSSVTSYNDTTAVADTTYVYNVNAEDDSGNESAFSADLNGSLIVDECTLDTDGNKHVDALTDGLLSIRHMFEILGASLVNDSLAKGCARCTASAIETFLDRCASTGATDIDGNGQVDALTDGLLIIRYIFGIRGAALINNSVGDACQRCTTTEIQDYLKTLIPIGPKP